MPDLASLEKESRVRIGRLIADYRNRFGQVLTQEKLAEELRLANRTVIAFCEEGRQLLAPDALAAACQRLQIPEHLWIAATHRFYPRGYVFHELSCELIGRRSTITDHAPTDQLVAMGRAECLFTQKLTASQAHAEVNALLVFYGERPMTRQFFDRFLGVDAFVDNESFMKKLRQYQLRAMRLYGNFRRAFTCMSRVVDLDLEMSPLLPRPVEHFKERPPFAGISEVAADRLADLGYIAAQRIEQENKDRHEVSTALLTLADDISRKGVAVVADMPKAKLRRLRTLLRQVESPIQLEEGLFSSLEPEILRLEAKKIAPEHSDLIRIAETQRAAQRNLGVYLSEPYMDVYIATSMREDADFQSVNTFVKRLFNFPSVLELNLRYFNPTQSWIEDRVAKGLVEALMLRRATVTVYMAQKGDTFGKDSEASVALGQGKTVIVFVPRLFDDESGIDSEKLFKLDSQKLDQQLTKLSITPDEGIDARERAKMLLRAQLVGLPDEHFKKVVHNHWADFDLVGEGRKIESQHLRSSVVKLVEGISLAETDEALEQIKVEDTPRFELIDRIVSVAEKFEGRAKTFRDIHPLSLQVIVHSGVLNGILVTRSIEDCGRLLRAIIENRLDMDVEVDDRNYRLVERVTRSTLRVVSKHRLLTFAFWSQYFDDMGQTSVPAVASVVSL